MNKDMILTDKEKEMGEWIKVGKHGKALTKPSQEYLDSQKPTEAEIDTQTNNLILKDIKSTDSDLARLIEDIADFLETLGFEMPQSKKDLIAFRKQKRSELK